jgi:hypothetical protein
VEEVICVQDNKKDKFEKVSDEETSNVAGGNVSMIYKPGIFKKWIVIDPKGRIQSKSWSKSDAFDEASKYSLNSPGCCRGAVRELSKEEYTELLRQERVQKDV